MKKTQVEEKLKIKILPKLIFGVALVVTGVGIGSVFFSFLPSVANTTMPPLNSSIEQWYLAFGGNKISDSDFRGLQNIVRNWGANVKIRLDYLPENNASLATANGQQARLIFQCEAIEFSGAYQGATCVTNNISLPENKTISAWANISKNGKNFTNVITLRVTTYNNSGEIINVKEAQYQNPNWLVR